MPTLYSIQYLRAFAAIAVVVFHAAHRMGLPFTIGAAGVDIFFVVSGFIMMAISDNRASSPASFLRNRVLRIAPTYWIATVVMVLGAILGLFPNLKLDPAHIAGSFLFIPVASPNSGNLWPVLVQGWTLNYEIFFYAVFALVLFLKPALRLPALALLFGLLVVGGALLQPANPLAGFYTAPVILEFVAGAAIAKAWQSGRLPSPGIGLLLVCLSIAGFAAIHLLRLEFDAWTCGPLAIMLVTGALAVEVGAKLPKFPALTYLGDSSYSIYLWHTFAISVVAEIGAALALSIPAIVLTAVVIGTMAGIAAYECLERPIQLLLKGKRSALWRLPLRNQAGRTPAQ
ncbi:acyltransferase [Rhizobium sp. LC145]|uniref:acyltransferase family protein n=1 Tax=Rhizobium sp. LC145 TaxID=1120688 RepID=UPI00062A3A6C|nr:acyltransferase [Rhizobium sp. LC145]KKX30782.1 exopolysaccharide biosynthesis protein [Rhizobium sp. LC145]TKT68487.1 acyltransferase [Rhizobiaceae bacterium LC148]